MSCDNLRAAPLRWPALLIVVPLLAACGPSAEQRAAGIAAFDTVAKVFQHPRCRNCHIPGDAPLQLDSGVPHTQGVMRGPEGEGAAGLACSTCHGETNPPASYGPHQPPGAPHWALPPPDQRMAWIGLPPAQLCRMIQDPKQNGDRDLAAMLEHVSKDKLVLWGWDPGAGRAPVGIAHPEFVAAFAQWVEAGAPCDGA